MHNSNRAASVRKVMLQQVVPAMGHAIDFDSPSLEVSVFFFVSNKYGIWAFVGTRRYKIRGPCRL